MELSDEHFANCNYDELQRVIISLDSTAIQEYNAKKKDKRYHLQKHMGPCPYEGNIDKAKVVLLLANPGYQPETCQEKFPSKYSDHIRNHDHADWGIFSLHPDSNPSMRNWWILRLQELKRQSGIASWQEISNKVAALQLNSWASEKFDSDCILPSMSILRRVAIEFSRRNVLFIACRCVNQWKINLSEIPSNRFFMLNSVMSSYITENNMSRSINGWKAILNKINSD